MIYHVLNGDALTERFTATGIKGEIIVARECLVDGNLEGNSLHEFFITRAKYLGAESDEKEQTYFDWVAIEFEKIMHASEGSEFNLWFGYDLFCRANMWFILSLLHDMEIRKDVFMVYPSYLATRDRWKDFGGASPADLQKCFAERIYVSEADIKPGKNLWTVFKNNELIALEKLATTPSHSFPYLQEVCKAHIDRFPVNGEKGRPEKTIETAIADTAGDFASVFREFGKREGIYGFGDTQVKHLYDKVIKEQ